MERSILFRSFTPLVAIERVQLVKYGALLTISPVTAFYKDLACSSMGLAHPVPSIIFFVLAQIASAAVHLSSQKHFTISSATLGKILTITMAA